MSATPPPNTTPRRLPVLLRRAWYGLNQAFRQRVGPTGITPDQYSILRWISEGDPQGLTQRAITDLMASDPNTITSTLARMERSGLVERRPHESDKRAHRVRLLPKGRRVFEKARAVAVELQQQVLGVLTDEECAQFLEAMARIADACTAVAQKPGRKKK
jgi:DNA-binding MarR family transcriptional regulator